MLYYYVYDESYIIEQRILSMIAVVTSNETKRLHSHALIFN